MTIGWKYCSFCSIRVEGYPNNDVRTDVLNLCLLYMYQLSSCKPLKTLHCHWYVRFMVIYWHANFAKWNIISHVARRKSTSQVHGYQTEYGRPVPGSEFGLSANTSENTLKMVDTVGWKYIKSWKVTYPNGGGRITRDGDRWMKIHKRW